MYREKDVSAAGRLGDCARRVGRVKWCSVGPIQGFVSKSRMTPKQLNSARLTEAQPAQHGRPRGFACGGILCNNVGFPVCPIAFINCFARVCTKYIFVAASQSSYLSYTCAWDLRSTIDTSSVE